MNKYFPHLRHVEATTAIYPNRVKDKNRIERSLKLDENGDDTTKFYSKNDTLLFVGYDRIVYGDHGPYIEFSEKHLRCKPKPRFNSPTPGTAFYEWRTVNDKSDVKLYWQLKTVKSLPNPPKGGFMGNRAEGYADYKVHFYYVSPLEIKCVKD